MNSTAIGGTRMLDCMQRNRDELRVRWAAGAKGKKWRRVPITPKLAAAIKQYGRTLVAERSAIPSVRCTNPPLARVRAVSIALGLTMADVVVFSGTAAHRRQSTKIRFRSGRHRGPAGRHVV